MKYVISYPVKESGFKAHHGTLEHQHIGLLMEKKNPDLLDFFLTNGISSTYTDIQSSYDLTSDHSPITATLSTSVIVRKPTPRLHNSKTTWGTYRQNETK